MKASFYAFIVFFILNSGFSALAQNVTRGPYLQSPGPNSIIVCWRTDAPTDSRVAIGTSLGVPDFTAEDNNQVTEHRVTVTGLDPASTYYYTIGTTSQVLSGPEEEMHFTTAPEFGSSDPIRIWAIGDFGHGNLAEQEVRDSYTRYAEEKPADLWLWLGDNVYQDGTDQEYTDKVFDSIYGFYHLMKNLPFASTSGNHDYNSICPWQPAFCNEDPTTHSGPYLDFIAPPSEGELGGVPSHLKIFYSFDYGDVHIVSLNSELGSLNPSYNWLGLFNTDTSFTSPMLEWLKDDLAATTKKWKIVIWHQTPYSGQDGFTDSQLQPFCVASRIHFNPILEHYGVDLVLVGHDHNYQRTYLINGHYGNSDTFTPEMMVDSSSGKDALGEAYTKYTDGPLAGKGTVYVVEGNSSGGNSYSPIEHPAIYWGQACDTCWGSFFVEVNGDRLDGKYLTSNDEILDEFTILKSEWTGINESEPVFNQFSISPNPLQDQLTISYNLLKAKKVSFEIVDIKGGAVYMYSPGMRQPGRYEDKLSVKKTDLAAGMYFLKASFGDTIHTEKLLLE